MGQFLETISADVFNELQFHVDNWKPSLDMDENNHVYVDETCINQHDVDVPYSQRLIKKVAQDLFNIKDELTDTVRTTLELGEYDETPYKVSYKVIDVSYSTDTVDFEIEFEDITRQ